MDFRELKADEINVRAQQVNEKGGVFLLYKDARCDMNILDESGVIWQRDHKEIKGNVYCGVSIWNEELNCWVTKWDCGSESNTEAEKGEASDSFKRACFNWGIGRELYTSPFTWIKLFDTEIDKTTTGKVYLKPGVIFKVKEIEYVNKQITKLVIVDKNDEVRFNWSLRATQLSPEERKQEQMNSIKPSQAALQELKSLGGTIENVANYYKKSVEEVSDADVRKVIAIKRQSMKYKGEQQ